MEKDMRDIVIPLLDDYLMNQSVKGFFPEASGEAVQLLGIDPSTVVNFTDLVVGAAEKILQGRPINEDFLAPGSDFRKEIETQLKKAGIRQQVISLLCGFANSTNEFLQKNKTAI